MAFNTRRHTITYISTGEREVVIDSRRLFSFFSRALNFFGYIFNPCCPRVENTLKKFRALSKKKNRLKSIISCLTLSSRDINSYFYLVFMKFMKINICLKPILIYISRRC